jgi:hypothetical protein
MVGTSTDDGGRDEYEQRAKDFAGIIGKEVGIISSESNILPFKETDCIVNEK